MTNKIKLVFFIVTVVSALAMMLGTLFIVDIADWTLLTVKNTLSLHEAPTPTALVVLVIPVLYLVFGQRRHS